MYVFFRYNMQKVTYVLLQRHANNYWQIDRDDDIRSSGMQCCFFFFFFFCLKCGGYDNTYL